MVYVLGPDELKERLKRYGITPTPGGAKCAVVQMPGNAQGIGNLPTGLPVFVIINGMMTLTDARMVRKPGVKVVKETELARELNKVFREAVDEDDELINFEEAPDSQDHSIHLEQILPKNFSPPRHSILVPRTMRGIIVPSYSASGGEGKTFIATSMGAVCAVSSVNAVVIDLDLGYGDVDVATGLVDEEDREKVMDKKAVVPKNGWATVTDWRKYAVNLKSNILRHNSGLYIIPAYPYAGRELPEAEIEDLLHTLSEIFDIVVVDLGVDGYSNQARVALRMANAILIVAGQDRKTIAKLNHFLTQEGGWNEKMHLIFNKRSPTAFYDPKEVAKKMSFEKYYSVPLDEQGVNAAKRQRKLVVQLPGSAAGEAVRNIASAILPFKIHAGEIVTKQKKGSFLTKFLKKLRKA